MLTKLINLIKSNLIYLTQQRPINSKDLTLFLRYFATLIASGIHITHAFNILENCQEKKSMRLLIYAIKRDILAGKNLFFSMCLHHQYFDDLTCQLIKIGEQTGKLDLMLKIIANHHEKVLAFHKHIKQILFYPTIIMICVIMLTIGMFMFIIPQFAELFQNVHIQLPFITICLFAIAAKLNPVNVLSCGLIFIIILFIYFYQFFPKHKKYLLFYFLKLPLLKSFSHKVLLARFTRNLSITYAAGIPIKEAIILAIDSPKDTEFYQLISKLWSQISRGQQLHRAMENTLFFPNMVIQMVKIGEETGMLEQMLEKTADFLEADIEQIISRFPQLLEPLIMLILGVLIGGIVIGMYLPIFKLGSAL